MFRKFLPRKVSSVILPDSRLPWEYWLMPDNRCPTAIFLSVFYCRKRYINSFCLQATEQAKRSGATFTDPDFPKAQLHTWLAWQQEPGCPYGTAMKAHFFRHDAPAAMAFVNWFKH